MEQWQIDMQSSSWYSDTVEITKHRDETRRRIIPLLEEVDNKQRIAGYQALLPHVQTNFFVETGFSFSFGQNITIGSNFYANKDVLLCDEGSITIGDNCKVGSRVAFYTPIHPLDAKLRRTGVEMTGAITIGNDVWIGGSATLLPNVTLGNNVIVGAGSVVTKSFPDNVVIAGNPAQIIRSLD